MTYLTAALNRKTWALGGLPRRMPWRPLVLAALAVLALSSAETFRIVAEALSEAYLTVAVFVAGTLSLIYGLERAFDTDLGRLLRRFQRWQVPVGALLGAFPGCGGAIVMVTQYTKGHASFGSLVATLTATMGDAMFLLLAKEPTTGLAVLGLGVVVGALSGLLVDTLHGPGFLRARRGNRAEPAGGPDRATERVGSPMVWLWFALMLPGLFLGLLDAFQVDFRELLPLAAELDPAFWLGLAGAVLALLLWARPSEGTGEMTASSCGDGVAGRILADTNFITAWVVFAFLAYELGVHLTGVELGAVFRLWAPLVPLAAILVGFLPGCGPQIVVTTLYLTGSLPLSAQLGNAISNDGDALFPALALAPRAALLATLYSALPALLIAYGYFLIFE